MSNEDISHTDKQFFGKFRVGVLIFFELDESLFGETVSQRSVSSCEAAREQTERYSEPNRDSDN